MCIYTYIYIYTQIYISISIAEAGHAADASGRQRRAVSLARRAAKRVDLHDHDHEERGEEDLLVAGQRSALSEQTPASNWASAWVQGNGRGR